MAPLGSSTQPFTVVSMYACWMRPHPSTRIKWRVGTPNASARRIMPTLSTFVGDTDPTNHWIIAAGDLNMVYKLPRDRPESFAERKRTVFARMEALGMELRGPWHPDGRTADPPPEPLHDPRNVSTYHFSQREPATAEQRLDYFFPSRGLHESVSVRALNSVEDWGSSDHCRIVIGRALTRALRGAMQRLVLLVLLAGTMLALTPWLSSYRTGLLVYPIQSWNRHTLTAALLGMLTH